MDKIKVKGISKFQVKKVIMEDGSEFDLDKICHIFIAKENDDKKNNIANFVTSYFFKNEEGYMLSNQCLMMANVIKYMDICNIGFEEAVKMHEEYIEELKKKWEK